MYRNNPANIKRIIFIFFIIMFSLNTSFSQTQKIDSTSIKLEMKTKAESDTTETKENFGSKVGNFFGIGKGKDKKIEELTKKVNTQKVLIDSMSVALTKPKIVIKKIPTLNAESAKSIKRDSKFISDLPKTYTNLKKSDITKLTKQIDDKIEELIKQRDSILKYKGNTELIDAKNNIIQSLQREKNVINLTQESSNLKTENTQLTDKTDKLKKYLYSAISILFVLLLIIAVIIQRKRIKVQDVEIDKQISDINKKNNYLEHAARIIRHDMHSGINTYIPRGLISLEKRITDEKAKELKIDGSIKMIKEGLSHTQKVYKGVYEFTNLVKQNVVLEVKDCNLSEILNEYINTKAYVKQVKIDELVNVEVNQTLFCTAIDNLVRNGLSFNDSKDKIVKIYMEDSNIVIEDNGRGLSVSKFENIKKNGSDGLGLSIALAILEEHKFDISCEEISNGTKIKIKLN